MAQVTKVQGFSADGSPSPGAQTWWEGVRADLDAAKIYDAVTQTAADLAATKQLAASMVGPTDAGVAALAKDASSQTNKSLDPLVRDKASAAFGWFPVTAYGAVGVGRDDPRLDGGAQQAALAATNDAAFKAAWDATLAAGKGGVIHMPCGVYPLANSWRCDIASLPKTGLARSLNISFQGDGAVLLSTGTATDSLWWVGASDSVGTGNMIRKVDIRGIAIQGRVDPLSSAKISRTGLTMYSIQEATSDRVWVSGFSYEGVVIDSVMDSDFHRMQILYCGNSSPTAASNRWALLITSTQTANPNAMRFHGLHIEMCPLVMKMDGPSMTTSARHIQFFGGKFEHGANTTNWGSSNPIHFGNVREVVFSGSMFVFIQRPVGTIQPPHYIYSSDDTQAVSLPHKSIRFDACDFTTPDNRSANWIYGAGIHAIGCTFQRSSGFSENGGVHAFHLRGDSTLRGCMITIANSSGLTGLTATADTFKLDGVGASVIDPVIYCAVGQAGSLVSVTSNASGAAFRGWRRTHGYPTTIFTDEATSTSDYGLDGRLRFDDFLDSASQLWPLGRVLAPGTPSVFGAGSHAMLQPGTFTELRSGYTGQHITLEAAGSVTLQGGSGSKFIFSGGASTLSLTSGQCVTFIRRGGSWKQTGSVS